MYALPILQQSYFLHAYTWLLMLLCLYKDPEASHDVNGDDDDPTPRYDAANENRSEKRYQNYTLKLTNETCPKSNCYFLLDMERDVLEWWLLRLTTHCAPLELPTTPGLGVCLQIRKVLPQNLLPVHIFRFKYLDLYI